MNPTAAAGAGVEGGGFEGEASFDDVVKSLLSLTTAWECVKFKEERLPKVRLGSEFAGLGFFGGLWKHSSHTS
jgi:hypothetical protein